MMLWQKLPSEAVLPKFVLNGFPKSGLHLAELMVSPVVRAQENDPLFSDAWVGTFNGHAWTNEWLPLRAITYRLARVQAGRYVKGHCGHRDEIEQFSYYSGAAVVFIYRDLRDVAVSQAHHILNPDSRQFKHPNKAIYEELGSFDAVLAAVIEGLGPYPGVLERWALYAPWLDCEWVLAMPFERMRNEPERASAEILEYGMRRVIASVGLEMRLDDAQFAEMVRTMALASQQRQLAANFRKGNVGGWREAFTPEHKKLFKAHDRDGWLVRLGYEVGDGW